MKALVVERPGAARLEDVPTPAPGPGEVLVRVGAAGICGSDVELLDGRRPEPYVRYPIVPGHEWAGVVEEAGAEVGELSPGDVVVAEGIRSCGRCARCRAGRTNLCAAEYAETGFTHPRRVRCNSSREGGVDPPTTEDLGIGRRCLPRAGRGDYCLRAKRSAARRVRQSCQSMIRPSRIVKTW